MIFKYYFYIIIIISYNQNFHISGGAIVIGQESIVYHDGHSYVAVAPPQIKVILHFEFDTLL